MWHSFLSLLFTSAELSLWKVLRAQETPESKQSGEGEGKGAGCEGKHMESIFYESVDA